MTAAVAGVKGGGHAAGGRDADVEGEVALFGIGVAAEDLEDRFAVGLGSRPAGRRGAVATPVGDAVAPAADGEVA